MDGRDKPGHDSNIGCGHDASARLRHDGGEAVSLREPDASPRAKKRAGSRRKGGSSPRAAPGEHARAFWAKAQSASQSAQLLLERGDTDGAVNRAYYAVFGAARAALATVRASLATSKRHGTIYRRFEKHLVQERAFDPSLGRGFLARQRRARQAADYAPGQVDEPTARTTVGEMQSFLAAVEPLLKKVKT
jgi:uncharacterized protein (UPF0332 family)